MNLNFPNSKIEINLSMIDNNIDAIKERSGGKKILAVVKCDGYSHGAVKVSEHVEKIIDWFAVATVDEGIELRQAGIRKPILVFGVPELRNAAAYQTHDLTATISHSSHFSILMDGTSYHLNFDTGMGRLGFKPEQAEEVRKLAIANQRLTCSGIYSHYATADDPGSDFVETQHRRFKELLVHFPEIRLLHMSNTGAVANYPHLNHFDMIRSGLGILGYNSGETRHDWLRPVCSWKTKIVQTRPVKKGEVVSYSPTWSAPNDGYISTLPVGYGDGIPRVLSNKLRVFINGEIFPQVGNVTMDYIMIFTGRVCLPVESEVILLGREAWTANDWAENADTIVHEILTNIHPKVEKRYIR